jgi:hypothetical protein
MRRTFTRSNLWVAALAAYAAAGCDSATGNKDAKISLSLTTSAVTLSQGDNETVLVSIARTNFNSAVALTIDGLPSGVTAAFAPVSIPDGATGSALELTASGAATPGSATLTVHATGEGISEQVATIDLTITVTGSFSLAPLKSSVSIAQGGGGMATVLVTRLGGNAGNVSLTASGAPAGVTATFTPATTTEKGASLSLAATGGAASGTYELTITGTSPSQTDQTTKLSLAVIAPPSTSPLTISFCPSETPIWFAYQNEGFAWQQATLTGSSFTFQATQKVAIAYVLQFGSAMETNVYYATASELSENTISDCRGTNTVGGSISTLASNQMVSIALGPSDTTVTGPTTSFTLKNVPAGPLDLLATRGTPAPGGYLTPDAMIVRRGLNQANGSSITPALNFATESATPGSFSLTVSGVEVGEEIYFQNFLLTGTATAGLLHNGAPITGSINVSSAPAALLAGNDLHQLYVEASQSTNTAIVGHSYFTYFGSPDTRNDALGPLLSIPTLSSLGASPYQRMRGGMNSQGDYNTSALFAFDQGSGFRTIYVGVSAAHLGATPSTWDTEIPDFSGTAGFNSSWMLSASPLSSTIYLAQAFSGRQELLFGAVPVAGDMVKSGYRIGFTTTALKSLVQGTRTVQRPRLQYFRR